MIRMLVIAAQWERTNRGGQMPKDRQGREMHSIEQGQRGNENHAHDEVFLGSKENEELHLDAPPHLLGCIFRCQKENCL